jgi:4-amino-4-deoxy-L-arabinose transferase-like glycosyltransferase
MNLKRITLVLFFVLGVLYFGSLDRISLTDPDEVFYSLSAREMLDSNSFVTPLIFGHPQFEKPPFFYWCLMGAFKLFGVNPLAARLIPALSGFLGIILTFFFCRRVFNEEIALISSIVLGTSAIYLVMSQAVLTDIILSVFITAAFYAFYLWFLEGKQFWLYSFAFAAALAVLTKGPIAIVILFVACSGFLLVIKEYERLREFTINPWVLLFCLLSIPWYAVVIWKYGHVFIDEFIIHDNWHRILYAEHKKSDTWYFYPMIMMAGLFPWTFYLVMMGRRWKEYRKECLFLLIWILVTFVIFQRAHSKLASYIVPLIPAYVILLSISLSAFSKKCRRISVLAVLYGLLGIGLIAAPSFLVVKFPDYVWPAVFLALRMFGAAFIGASVYLWRGNVLKAIVAQTFGMILMLVIAGSNIPSSIDSAASDKYLQPIIRQQGYEGPIVTNKLFARGIYFYTGNPVVVMDHDKQPFWSPHPIEVITGYKEIRGFFDPRQRVLCVLKKRYVEDLDRIFQGKRDNRILSKDGNKIVILSEKIHLQK